jgi:uncharacterized membrane protein
MTSSSTSYYNNVSSVDKSISSSALKNLTPQNPSYTIQPSMLVEKYDNNNTIDDLINSLNQNMAYLNTIQTQMNVANNLEQEALLKKSELIKLENEDLQNQLRELEIIQSTITNKDRLIEQTDLNTMNDGLNVFVLKISIVFALLLLAIIYMYGNKRLVAVTAKTFITIIIIIYGIFIIYIYNIFSFKNAIHYFSHRETLLSELKLNKWGNFLSDDAANRRQQQKDQWIANNCACMEEEEQEEEQEEEAYFSSGSDKIVREVPGYYYYDKSAPKEFIAPIKNLVKNVVKTIHTPEKNREPIDYIEWPDYSPNGMPKYNKSTGNITRTNTNYYNYNKKNDNSNLTDNIYAVGDIEITSDI